MRGEEKEAAKENTELYTFFFKYDKKKFDQSIRIMTLKELSENNHLNRRLKMQHNSPCTPYSIIKQTDHNQKS